MPLSRHDGYLLGDVGICTTRCNHDDGPCRESVQRQNIPNRHRAPSAKSLSPSSTFFPGTSDPPYRVLSICGALARFSMHSLPWASQRPDGQGRLARFRRSSCISWNRDLLMSWSGDHDKRCNLTILYWSSHWWHFALVRGYLRSELRKQKEQPEAIASCKSWHSTWLHHSCNP